MRKTRGLHSGLGDDIQVLLAAREGPKSTRLERAICQASSWAVHRVVAGDAALRLLETHAFDLFVIDSKLPVVRASELCRILRGRPTTAGVPLVVVEFDLPDAHDQARASVTGADDYVDARAPDRATASKIRSVLARRRAIGQRASGREYRHGSLVANFGDRYVSVNGKPLTLQRLEFEVLEYLVERRNRVVTRQELFEEVWASRGRIEKRTIDVHVCRLRRKLGQVRGQILPLVSMGYMFVDGEPSAPK